MPPTLTCFVLAPPSSSTRIPPPTSSFKNLPDATPSKVSTTTSWKLTSPAGSQPRSLWLNLWPRGGVSRAPGTPPDTPREPWIQVAANLPFAQGRLTAWAAHEKSRALVRLGVGGPALSTAAFTAGVNTLTTTINDNARDRLTYERAKALRSFTDKHGAALAQKLHNLCGVPRDEDLPDIHKLVAMAPKGRESGILTNAFEERVDASPVPLTLATVPLVTTKLLTECFLTFSIAGPGIIFGQGLSPFAVACAGHKESEAITAKLRQAALASQGTSLSLSDAVKLTATDVRFPTTPQTAAEKLYGWSVVIDIFHGVNTPISNNIRRAVIEIAPSLHTLFNHHGGIDDPRTGMDVVNRVLYEMQQDYFGWASETSRLAQGAALPTVPDFKRISSMVASFRADSLSSLPSSWYTLLDPPKQARQQRNPSGSGSNPRDVSGSTSITNPHSDADLVRRFRESEFTSIKAMMEGKDCNIPKHAGSDVCLAWAFKGRCNTQCSRKQQHERYSRDTNRSLHTLLDECGVASAQV